MTRKKIQMKRIDNTTARQVTFSERRKCIFKKALELSTLCEAEIALIVIRATGKLFDYGSPRARCLIGQDLFFFVLLVKFLELMDAVGEK
ncbi:hypothetical protein CIPAW_03G196500 [Carya illinoinensis]|uniref:MADS-box domain-containing protein n=1 Tax=Carya illinoinensis TaxID=32201 RepID=A0A8T1R4U1_CARIL|nr:hypothetical protein CIPAW_03G196500 [Carya illinoinensis]